MALPLGVTRHYTAYLSAILRSDGQYLVTEKRNPASRYCLTGNGAILVVS